MVMSTLSFIKGETWQPNYAVERNNAVMDCTGFDAYLHFTNNKNIDEVIHVTWTEQGDGKGYFDLTHIVSKDLRVGEYEYEAVLFKEDGTFKKVTNKGVLEVTDTLEKEIKQR